MLLKLPSPAEQAPPGLGGTDWGWALGSEPADVEAASKFWRSMAEDYLVRARGPDGRKARGVEGRRRGLRTEKAPLVRELSVTLEAAASHECRGWAALAATA